MPKELKLAGLNVVFFESRLAKTMGDMLALHGAAAFSAPSMKEVPLENNPAAFSFGEALLAGRIERVILLTGVGTRALMTVLETRHPKEKILEALKKTVLIPRGPKPIRVLNEWGVPFQLSVPEPNTWKEILKTLDENQKTFPLSGKRVAVQEYGVVNQELLDGLAERGADVLRVPVYRWALPDDTGPLKKAIQEMLAGKTQVALFTTSVQADHLFKVAGPAAGDLKKAMNKMVIASVGPDCSEALRSHGLGVDIEPETPKMGPLVIQTAEKAALLLEKKSHG